MAIEIKDYVEHEDGSATLVFDCDEDTKKHLIEAGFIYLVKKWVDEERLEPQMPDE